MVRGAVLGRKPGSIHAENYRQVLATNIMDDAVVRTLKER